MDYSIFYETAAAIGIMIVGAWVFRPTPAERKRAAEIRRKDFECLMRAREQEARNRCRERPIRLPREPWHTL